MSRPKGSKNRLPGYTESDPAPDIVEEIKDAAKLCLFTNQIDEWIAEGTCCKYVRFCHIAVSPAQGKEPVWEFKLDPKTKYSVDSMVFNHNGGLIFTAYGEKCVVAPGNVGYWRPL